MTMQDNKVGADAPAVREVDPDVFEKLGARDAAFLLVNTKDGDEEILIPKGSEWEISQSPDDETARMGGVSARSCYTKCVNGIKYRCCNNVCVQVGTC